jgi:hypothetical protein
VSAIPASTDSSRRAALLRQPRHEGRADVVEAGGACLVKAARFPHCAAAKSLEARLRDD